MKQLTSYNRVAGYLNKIFDLLNEEYFESTLQRPTITIQSTPKAYGHFSLREDTWISKLGGTHEINLGAGTISRSIEFVVAKELKALIAGYLIRSGYTKEDLAIKLGISLASLYNKMKDIDKFTFKEITILFSLLKLDDETKLKLMAA